MDDHEFIVNEAGAENASMIPLKIETQSRLRKNLVANRGHQKAPRDVHARDHHVTRRRPHPIGDVKDHAIVVNSIIVSLFRSYQS